MEDDLQHTSKKIKKNDKLEVDRLSSLPNPIIYRILSLTETKTAVQSCIWSKKWQSHWIHINSLSFYAKSFSGWLAFRNFVLKVLEKREPCNLSSLKLFCGSDRDLLVINRTLDYAKSHNVVELATDARSYPLSYFPCETLRTLKLGPGTFKGKPIPFDFTRLTTLQLSGVDLYDMDRKIFSACLNLENLLLTGCHQRIECALDINAPPLTTLTIRDMEFRYVLKIIAPKLKYLYYSGTRPTWVINDRPDLKKVSIIATGVKNESDMIKLAEKITTADSLKISFDTHKKKHILSRDPPVGEFRFVPCLLDQPEDQRS